MLRFLLVSAVGLSAVFTLVGAMLSREWGWSEYASDALYVVFQTGQDYYLAEVDDTPDDEEKLVWHNERMTAIDCSPDGQAFAFLTDVGRVVIVMSDGTIEEALANKVYANVSVANNGSVALFDPETGELRTNMTMNLSELRRVHDYDSVELSSYGFALWSQNLNGIEVFSPETGERVMFVPRATAGKWLASEKIFTFMYSNVSAYGLGIRPGWYFGDVNARTIVSLNMGYVPFPFSPDGLEVSAGLVADGRRQSEQIFVFNPWIDYVGRQLTTNLDVSHWPLCFLTFRPEMLIDDSP